MRAQRGTLRQDRSSISTTTADHGAYGLIVRIALSERSLLVASLFLNRKMLAHSGQLASTTMNFRLDLKPQRSNQAGLTKVFLESMASKTIESPLRQFEEGKAVGRIGYVRETLLVVRAG